MWIAIYASGRRYPFNRWVRAFIISVSNIFDGVWLAISGICQLNRIRIWALSCGSRSIYANCEMPYKFMTATLNFTVH